MDRRIFLGGLGAAAIAAPTVVRSGSCPKCGRNDLDLNYDPVFDRIKVECLACGHIFDYAELKRLVLALGAQHAEVERLSAELLTCRESHEQLQKDTWELEQSLRAKIKREEMKSATDEEIARALFAALEAAADDDAYMGSMDDGEVLITIDGRFNLILVAKHLRRILAGRV